MTIISNGTNSSNASGLSISTSNVLINQTPIITNQGVGEISDNISDPDHSLNYTSGTANNSFLVSYGAQVDISYVAISGHNSATQTQATIELYNETTLIDSVVLQRNNNVMFTFPSQAFQDLIIKFVTVPKTYQTTVSYIAAGKHITILTGEQSGYSRQWLNRHITQRTTTRLQVSPVSSITQKKALSGSLSLPNETISFAENTWQSFIDFAFEQPFFIKEVSSKPESSYICFDPEFSTKSHSQTRSLDSIQLKFTVFNGL